jgi:hypothetical protein
MSRLRPLVVGALAAGGRSESAGRKRELGSCNLSSSRAILRLGGDEDVRGETPWVSWPRLARSMRQRGKGPKQWRTQGFGTTGIFVLPIRLGALTVGGPDALSPTLLAGCRGRRPGESQSVGARGSGRAGGKGE